MTKLQKNNPSKEKTARPIEIGPVVRRLREEKKLSGAELCRRGKGIDPKTLTALEKGRIRNPSIVTLEALAKGFGMTVSDLFRRAEFDQRDYFSLGSQKGLYKIDLPSQGIQLISFTPLMEDLFCGKMILEGQRRFDEKFFRGGGAFFVMTLIGQFEGEVEGRKVTLKEGDNLYFWGGMKFRLSNALQRNSSLLLVTAPSCLGHRFS
jgi:transcriptional regulator with XRE-family HTH domain